MPLKTEERTWRLAHQYSIDTPCLAVPFGTQEYCHYHHTHPREMSERQQFSQNKKTNQRRAEWHQTPEQACNIGGDL